MPGNLYIRFDRGRDDVSGPVFGPYEYVQQTYQDLRISPDGETLAQWFAPAGEWFIVDGGEHNDEFYSDYVVFASDEAPSAGDHNCEAGRLTVGGEAGDMEQRWDNAAGTWVATGRTWNDETGQWSAESATSARCGICADSPTPGILFPTDFDDREASRDGKVFIARHDECAVYASDVEAAEAVAKATGWPVCKSYDRDDEVDLVSRAEKQGTAFYRPYFAVTLDEVLNLKLSGGGCSA